MDRLCEEKEEKAPALAKVVPAAPVLFNDAANSSAPKMRSMSVMSVQINAAGEEEDVIMTKLSRVEGGGAGQDKKKQQHTHTHTQRHTQQHTNRPSSVIEEGGSSEEEHSNSSSSSEEEDGEESAKDLCLDSAAALKRYTNHPEHQWNSKDFYSFNDTFGVEEFQEVRLSVHLTHSLTD
jgi:hypothetical protein